jgi:hypothetical protein
MPMRFDLAQGYPTAGSLTPLYTVAAGHRAVVSSVVVCNQTGERRRFRIAIARQGEPDNQKHYLYYDTPLPFADTFVATIGATMGAPSEIRVYSEAGGCSFTAFFHELEP